MRKKTPGKGGDEIIKKKPTGRRMSGRKKTPGGGEEGVQKKKPEGRSSRRRLPAQSRGALKGDSCSYIE